MTDSLEALGFRYVDGNVTITKEATDEKRNLHSPLETVLDEFYEVFSNGLKKDKQAARL